MERDTIFIAYIAIIHWRIFTTGLIFLFLFYFVVRALWIGLGGLNSVYPGGFKSNELYSKHYQAQLKAEIRQRSLDCAKEYLYIAVNGRQVTDYGIYREYRTNEAGRQFGYWIMLTEPDLTAGPNVVEVTTDYPPPRRPVRRVEP